MISFVLLFFTINIAIIIYIFWMKKQNNIKSKWGVNFKALNPNEDLKCPGCAAEIPKIRKPNNIKQFLWGGFTCNSCGNEYNKWLK